MNSPVVLVAPDPPVGPSCGRSERWSLGGALTGVALRLGLTEPAEAKAKKHKAKSAHKRHRPDERDDRGQLQAQGKGKKKKHKKPKPPPPLPPECQHCNDCQMCQDGACVSGPGAGGRALPGQRGQLRLLPGRGLHRHQPAAVPGRGLPPRRRVLPGEAPVRRRHLPARRPVLRGTVQVSPRRPVRGPIRLLPRRRPKEVPRPRNPEGVLLRGAECLLRRP